MDLTGKVIEILPEYTTNSGKTKYGFVVETGGQYPQKIPFEVWGADKWTNMRPTVGMDVVVSFDISSRSWKEKLIVSLNAWKVIPLAAANAQGASQGHGQAQQQPAPQAQAPAQEAKKEDNDDLPW